MTELPNPLTPADCDLRDFPYMPLDVLRLRDSDLAARTTGEEFRCAVLLWCASWHQVPAGSLPDDDVNLATYAGFGRMVDQWLLVKDGALRGWIRCSDGRLYHPVVAEKANDGWHSKHKLSHDKLCERVRKRNKARAESNLSPLVVPELDQWIDLGRPLERALFPAEFGGTSAGKQKPSDGNGKSSGGNDDDFHRKPPQIPPEYRLKGEGREGNGEVNLKPTSPTGVNGTSAHEGETPPLAAVEISKSLIGWERERHKQARGVTASNIQVIEIADLGVTELELRTAYEAAVADREATSDPTPVNAGFVKAFIEKHRRPVPKREPRDDWWKTNEGIERKGRELGISPGRLDWNGYRDKINEALRRRDGGQAA